MEVVVRVLECWVAWVCGCVCVNDNNDNVQLLFQILLLMTIAIPARRKLPVLHNVFKSKRKI